MRTILLLSNSLFLCLLLVARPTVAEKSALPVTTDTADMTLPSILNGIVSANVGIYSRYVWRGIVQSDDSPALQGSLDYALPISENISAFIGVWGSNVDFNDNHQARVELDIYGGIAYTIDDLTLKSGITQYYYPGSADRLNYDFYEFFGEASYDFDVVATTASVRYSPDFFGSAGDATYYLVDAVAPLPHNFSAKTYVGHQEVDEWQNYGYRDYNHWGVALGYDVPSETIQDLSIGVEYSNTTISDNACARNTCDELVILSVSKSF